MLRGKFIAIQFYIKKQETSNLCNTTPKATRKRIRTPKKTKKQQTKTNNNNNNKPEVSRRKEIIKIIAKEMQKK